jgi:UDP-N-acetylglucosamine--N-acetylmuramyl-(pentapeptide) pyrophosphoryl-undecaprenol N-acetylglucosamine transferase
MSNQNKQIGFFVCGLTGGPYFPIPAILKQLENDIEPVLIGVCNSYETKISQAKNIPIEYLPSAKLSLVTFKNQTFSELLYGILDLCKSIFLLSFSFCKSVFLLLKYQPKLIYATGSFLQVPLIWSTVFLKFFGLVNTKVIIHQQDPLLGLATKLTLKYADLSSCVFDYTNQRKPRFDFVIPNPILVDKYLVKSNWANSGIEQFLNQATKPVLLVFGGGSGSLFINTWIIDNLNALLTKYCVVHITGVLQTANLKSNLISNENYLQLESVLEDMPNLLQSVDLVICRAGLGSISELKIANKPTFLVPLPDSHQELNAKIVASENSNFSILEQKNVEHWLNTIVDFEPKNIENPKFDSTVLEQYYTKLKEII